MGFFKKVFRPVRKIAKKIIPKEIRPFLPYAAAMIPGAQGLASLNQFMTPVFQKALLAGATSAATDEQGNPLRAAALAAAPDVLSKGLGAVGTKLGVPGGVDVEGTMTFAERIGEGARSAQGAIGRTSPLKIAAAQTAIDSSAKFAEIRQDEIDQYNKNLLEQGVASKVDRRNAIFSIYKNAGYDDDYVNTMLDTYGYADGGRIGYANGGYRGRAEEALANARSINDVMPAFFKKRPKKKTEIVKVEDDDEDEEGNKKSTTFNINIPKSERSSDLSSGLMAAMDGVQKAYGRSFGEMEPTEFKRFARGGEVEIEEQTDDLGIMDLMRDQGVEYGEQVSNAQNDELLEKLFEEFLDLGFSPEDAAKKAREAFDDMSQGQGIKGTQVASGYKDDIEEMYEQYVFEMEEQGLQPMDFASFLRQARSGMASGGSVGSRYSFLIDKYNKGIPLSPSEEEELEMLEMTYADDSQGYAGGGKIGALIELGKAGITGSMKGISKLKNMVVNKLSRMTDDVELRGSSDYAEDTGASFELQITAKSKKGKKTLDGLVEEGVVEKLDDNTYFISDANRDSISGMKGLKASGMLDEGAETFTRFDEGAGMGPYDMPYAGYDEVIETFKKAEGGIMNKNLLNTGMDKDMRGGGFIPEGTKEKADDVPARLSKNEFVMTADAVRAAGGGSVNEGAKRMYETMHKLEAKV